MGGEGGLDEKDMTILAPFLTLSNAIRAKTYLEVAVEAFWGEACSVPA